MTDKEILNEIQHHMMETPNNGASMDSDLWDISSAIKYLNSSYRTFSSNTRTQLSISEYPTTVGVSRYDLKNFSNGIIDITRLAFHKSCTIQHILVDVPNDDPTGIPFLYPWNDRRRGWMELETGIRNREYALLQI